MASRFKSVLRFTIVAMSCVLLPAVAHAQVDGGVRAGLSLDPDQFYVGGHLETNPLVERLVFRPNAEVGFGDDVTALTLNFEFVWKFARRSDWGVYAGGGPAINFYQHDGSNDDTDGGFNFVGGFENRKGLFFEFKVGLEGSPDFKFGVGFTFR